ncbi:YjbQ family protein [Patescibacteria group bacterium]|nr:YjbQ family protein [Patescibacteria group bacterium]
MQEFAVKTSKRSEILDLTEKVNQILKDKKIKTGLCSVFVKHTTCALAIAELEQYMELDFFDAINEIFPDLDYRHAHDPSHVGEHIMSSIIGHSVTLPFRDSKLDLGTWQSLVLVELSGPRDRKIVVNLIDSG